VQRSVPCDVKSMEALANFGNGLLQSQETHGIIIAYCIIPLRNGGKTATSGVEMRHAIRVNFPTVSLKDISGQERRSLVLGLNKTLQRSVPCDVKSMEALVKFGNGLLQSQELDGLIIAYCIIPLRKGGKTTTSGVEMRHAIRVNFPTVSLKVISGLETKSLVLRLKKIVQRSAPRDVKRKEARANFGNGLLQIQETPGIMIADCILPLRKGGKTATSGLEMRLACKATVAEV